MKRMLLVPHGQTSWNAEGRIQGHTDVVMNDLGREQARQAAQALREEKIGAVIASDLSRASETAAIIGAQIAVPVRIDPRLREIHFGDWEGLAINDIAVQHPASWQRWEKGILTTPPQGETLESLAARLGACLEEMLHSRDHDDQTVLVVAHRGSLRVLMCLAMGVDANLFHRFRLDQASVSELLISPRGAVLNRLNDIHHLRELPHAR
jgi:glucosyl-3-phosphoglycerate phosphatase